MNLQLDCMPCLAKNGVDLANRLTTDPAMRQKIIRRTLHFAADLEMATTTPPQAAPVMTRLALEEAGLPLDFDAYREEKVRSTQMAMALLERLPEMPGWIPGDFACAVRMAIFGNIIDYGINGDLDLASAQKTIAHALKADFANDAISRLQERMNHADKILYLLDNCGEAVFDGMLIRQFRHKITIGIRGGNIYNDVTREFLEPSGLSQIGCPVIENGTCYPGTILSECTPEFQKAFWEADLIISKGQGNFETLHDVKAPVAFLFLAKCPVVTRMLNVPINQPQLILP